MKRERRVQKRLKNQFGKVGVEKLMTILTIRGREELKGVCGKRSLELLKKDTGQAGDQMWRLMIGWGKAEGWMLRPEEKMCK